jgi:2-polyprenyl-3-methyl-5-hydroxy-6-metoxy-1,4-benzoquinol methylase
MKVFDHYAQYYDLLYSVKDYEAEANYVSSLIGKFGPGAKSMLDIGCGTGSHGLHFAQRGYDVTGVDLSPQMISLANQKKAEKGIKNISFEQGNILSLHLDRQFDVVVSLFHVMNYLTKTSDMAIGFVKALNHVRPGGLFIFDSWYGPAVLSDLPKVGIRRFENDRIKVTRLAEPALHPNRNVVDVNYEIIVQEKANADVAFINETHAVRYFFKPEIEELLGHLGVEMLAAEEWLTGKTPGLDTFGVCFVGRK